MLIVPAALRMQWRSELFEKFYIDSLLMESAVYNKLRKEGVTNPFDVRDRVVICSYQFASKKAIDLQLVPWDWSSLMKPIVCGMFTSQIMLWGRN